MTGIDASILFSEMKIGNAVIKNRLVRSATYESVANEDGTIGVEYSRIHTRLSRGNIGLIFTGMMAISQEGKSYRRQAGLESDRGMEAFCAMNEEVHRNGAKIFAQLAHGGRQTMLHGRFPRDVSPGPLDLMYQVRPIGMSVKEIVSTIDAFSKAAARAKLAGFDGVQIHAAHGYLVSNFLSPYFNRRSDEWGGDSERRFALLKRIYESIRESVGSDFPIAIKTNISDHVPGGITPEEATEHIARLARLRIDAVEISCGSIAFSPFDMSRGKVPAKDLSRTMPVPLRPFAHLALTLAFPEYRYVFEEGYNLWASEKARSVLGNIPLIVVGGFRSPVVIENALRDRKADFVSLCRPLICEPLIAKRWSEGDMRPSICTNCNKCLAGVARGMPLRCYQGTSKPSK